MAERQNEEEEKFFQLEERELREKRRQEKQLAAIRQREREGIALALNTNEEIAQEAMELGFDAETAPVLPLVPIIQMAWADGKVTIRESNKVLEVAASSGLSEGSPAHGFLGRLLDEQPTDVFFNRVNQLLMNMISADPATWSKRNLVDLAREVAAASGGFLGLTSPINKEEQELLDKFAKIFSVETKKAPIVSPLGD